jgi:PAS domain S-box-containing protein
VHHLKEDAMGQTRAKTHNGDADEASNAIEERLRIIIDTIPTIVWRKLPDGSADFLNQHFREYTGLSLEDGLGWGWMNAFHPDDRLMEEWRAALAAGKPFGKEARLRRVDGQYRWFLIRAVPLRDEQGNLIKWYGTTIDIEDRKQAEDRIRLIIDTIPTMAWSVRPDGTVDFVNKRWLEYTGLSFEEEIEEPNRVVHPEDLPRVMEKWLADKAAGEPSEDEMRLQRADGEYRWFLVRTAPLRDEQGNVVKWYGVSIDIEARKRAKEERRRGEVYLAMAQRMAQMGVWSWNPSSGDMFGSQELYRILGIDPDETKLTREIFARSIHPEDRSRYDSEINAAVDEKRNWEIDYRIVLTDGSLKYIQGIGRPVFASSGEPLEFVGTTVDITDRKLAEEELRRLSGQLLRSQDEERRRIARDLHDSTGQDLVALATTLGQLRGSIPSVERKSRRILSQCKALADRCIRDVRTLSYVLHPPVLDEAGLGDAIRDYVKGFSKRSGIHVELELSPRLGRMARDVELALFRVVQEALTNIQRHSGSQRARIRIYRNSDLTLEISDLGHGVSVSWKRGKEEPRFEIGVGIPSMQERVKLVGGRLAIESTSEGTTVRVTISLGAERS